MAKRDVVWVLRGDDRFAWGILAGRICRRIDEHRRGKDVLARWTVHEELRMRRRLGLPPFARLVELTLLGSSREQVDQISDRLGQGLRRGAKRSHIAVLGPAPHRIPRLRRKYRSVILLKGRTAESLVTLVRGVLQPGRKFHGLPVIVDVDPL